MTKQTRTRTASYIPQNHTAMTVRQRTYEVNEVVQKVESLVVSWEGYVPHVGAWISSIGFCFGFVLMY